MLSPPWAQLFWNSLKNICCFLSFCIMHHRMAHQNKSSSLNLIIWGRSSEHLFVWPLSQSIWILIYLFNQRRNKLNYMVFIRATKGGQGDWNWAWRTELISRVLTGPEISVRLQLLFIANGSRSLPWQFKAKWGLTDMSEHWRFSVAGQKFCSIPCLLSSKHQALAPNISAERKEIHFGEKRKNNDGRTRMTDDCPPLQNPKSKFEAKGGGMKENVCKSGTMGWMQS